MTAPKGIRYIPAIDGLRAIAVIAVLLYHLGFSWIPGGFLGVDLFFVISGYVITRLLLDSIQRSGGLDLRGFYAGRIRRLLPPLLFMLVITAIFVGVWAPDSMRRFLTDAPFALTGLMNWWLVFKEQDYFESFGRPPLLQHLFIRCGGPVLLGLAFDSTFCIKSFWQKSYSDCSFSNRYFLWNCPISSFSSC